MAAKQAASGFPYPPQENQVMNAWERLVCGVEFPADGVRTVIERSGVRCHSAGVDPATTRAPSPTSHEVFSRLLHRFRDVIDVGGPVMEQVRESLSESGTMMILTDPSGVILKTEGDPATLEAAEDVRLVNGANWDELKRTAGGCGRRRTSRTARSSNSRCRSREPRRLVGAR